jgi:hypothetical protein
MEKEIITLIGGLNSIGVPYTRDNIKHIGFFNIIESNLIQKGYDVRSINMFRLNKNHTWDFEKIFTDNISLSEINKLQSNSIADLRAVNPFFKLIIPRNYANNFITHPSDSNQSVSDVYFQADNPVVIYSCGLTDFFSFIGAGPVEILNSEVRNKMPKNYTELIIKVILNIKRNLELLNHLNPKVKIMAIGISDTPLYYKIECLIHLQKKIKNKDLRFERKIDKLIDFYNTEMKKMCLEFDNVEFIDISNIKNHCAPFDFHPNTIGNQLIAEEVNEKLKGHLPVIKENTQK